VARLIRTANRSWDKEKAECPELDPDTLPSLEQTTRETDSLVPEALDLLSRTGIQLSEPATRLIAEAVDQAVDFLADEADRACRTGPGILQPPPARMVNRARRASSRVASCHPGGAILRSLVLGSEGLVASALAERLRAASSPCEAPAGPSNTQSWVAGIARLEATIDHRLSSPVVIEPAPIGSTGHVGAGVVAASA
jgi:hypothetical protein